MSGGGIGGTLGSVLGAALAPETGGMSLMIPALAGAAGAGLGGALTGSKNPLMDALMGGIGGGLSGASGLGSELGISNSAGLFDPAAAAGAEGAGLGSIGGDSVLSGGVPSLQLGGAEATPSLLNSAVSPALGTSGAIAGTPSASSGIMGYLGKQNPLNLALAGGSVLSGVQSLLPQKKVDIGQNAANVMATNPNFNASIPQYSMQNTATPYAGDWYKYGQTPQPVMYNAQPQKLARGGMVGCYAKGGDVAQNPLGAMPPQAMGSPPPEANPLVLKAAHDVGVQIGKHLKKQSPVFTGHGKVGGDSGGQDDAVPARLSSGEFVVPADVVGHLGDGSSDAGAKKLTEMMGNVRKQKSGKGFPKKSKKNPLNYVKGA